MRAMCLIAVAAVTVGMTGCGGGGADGAVKDQIAAINELTEALKSGDAAKAKAAAAKAQAAGKKLEDLKLSAEDKKKLEEKYKDQMAAAALNMLGAMMSSKLSEADMKEIGGMIDKVK